jgi:dUTP pyrophosphatase
MYFELIDGVPGILPVKSTSKAAAYDLSARHSCVVEAGQTALIKTGVRTRLPDHVVGLVCSRSGLALKDSVFVLNAPGVIDADYEHEIGVILFNAGFYPFHVDTGMRVAQMLFVHSATYADAGAQNVRTGGFGSTGVSNRCIDNVNTYDELDTPK